jgi:signal transduction histidine kinase
MPFLEAEVLFYAAREAIKNSARYGRAAQGKPLELGIRVNSQEGLRMVIEDNGTGVDPRIEPVQAHHRGGSGQGLAIHSTLLAVIGGSLSLDSEPGRYTRVILALPGSEAGRP